MYFHYTKLLFICIIIFVGFFPNVFDHYLIESVCAEPMVTEIQLYKTRDLCISSVWKNISEWKLPHMLEVTF
jgi:hypothetical protein